MIPKRRQFLQWSAMAASCAGARAAGGEVVVGEPRLIDQYEGPLRDSNYQGHHFPGLIKAGNGNLIALYRLGPDIGPPENVPMEDLLKNWAGHRVSRDSGRTWSDQKELDFGGVDGGTLADGTVLIPNGLYTWWLNEHEARLHINRSVDGGSTWLLDKDVRIRFPKSRKLREIKRLGGKLPSRPWLAFWASQIIPLEGQSALATMFGQLADSQQMRSLLIRTNDNGKHWDYVSCIAGDLPAPHQGFYGVGLVRLGERELLAVCQTEFANPRILVQCRSTDLGKTWSEPILAPGIPRIGPDQRRYTMPNGKPGGMDGALQHPMVIRLSSGPLILSFGRPGIFLAINWDGTGRSWDHVERIVPLGFQKSYCATDVTSGKAGIAPTGEDSLLIAYDVRQYANTPQDRPMNSVFVREVLVRKSRSAA